MIFEYTIIIFKCSKKIKELCNDIRKHKRYYFVEIDTDIPINKEEYFFTIMKADYIICENITEEIERYKKKYNVKIIML